MSRLSITDVDPLAVDPDHLSLLLARHGWIRRSQREGLFVKWINPELPAGYAPGGLIIPLDPSRGDYGELLTDAVTTLVRLAGFEAGSARAVLAALLAPGDEVRFIKDVPVKRGAVPWSQGEDLFAAAKSTLIAAAKARLSRRAYYGNTHGRFASRFIDEVLMGQTDVGSFIVTAYTPPESEFPERPTSRTATDLSYTGRDITQMLATSLRAASAAASVYRENASVGVFHEAVKEGVSRELVEALSVLIAGSDGAEVRIEWAPATQMALLNDASPAAPVTVGFDPPDASVFQSVAPYLASLEPTAYVRLVGWVSLVSRPQRRRNGVIRLRVVQGSEARSVQVRLTADQFELAAGAVAREQGIVVSGRQEREGNRYWLHDVTDISVLDLPPPDEDEARRPARNQMSILEPE